jgi:hypothetical protein
LLLSERYVNEALSRRRVAELLGGGIFLIGVRLMLTDHALVCSFTAFLSCYGFSGTATL